MSVPVQIQQPNYDYEITNMVVPKPYLKAGEREEVTVEIKNKGNLIWKEMGRINYSWESNGRGITSIHCLPVTANVLDFLRKPVKPGESGAYHR